MSFTSFYKRYEYLLDVCSVLLPYYLFGFQQYSHRFFVFWSDYEELICEMLGLLPAPVSITKVNDALLAYVNTEGKGEIKKRFYDVLNYLMNTTSTEDISGEDILEHYKRLETFDLMPKDDFKKMIKVF
jgi:hypothetical protein